MNLHQSARVIETIIVSAAVWSLVFLADAIALEANLLFKLKAPGPQNSAGFGRRLASVDGDIVVGESERTGATPDVKGQAYLFDGHTGALKHTFVNPIDTEASSFGFALSGGDGQVFIAGLGSSMETVYAYDADSGALKYSIDNLIENPESDFIVFGDSLAYGDGSLLVGAPGYDDDTFRDSGRVYQYDTSSGASQNFFDSPAHNTQNSFGAGLSLAVVDDKVIVGAHAFQSFIGQAWVFDRETTNMLYPVVNPNPVNLSGDSFGFSIAANENIIAIGAPNDATGGFSSSGTVYLFDSQTGDLLQTLFSPNIEMNARFGRSVALTAKGDVLIGSWGETVEAIRNAGRAYLFDGNTGALLLEIPNPEPRTGAGFGWAVSAFGNKLVVGLDDSGAGLPAPGGGAGGPGAVYVFSIVPEPNMLSLLTLAAMLCACNGRNPRR